MATMSAAVSKNSMPAPPAASATSGGHVRSPGAQPDQAVHAE